MSSFSTASRRQAGRVTRAQGADVANSVFADPVPAARDRSPQLFGIGAGERMNISLPASDDGSEAGARSGVPEIRIAGHGPSYLR